MDGFQHHIFSLYGSALGCENLEAPFSNGRVNKKKRLVKPDACGTCFRTFPNRPPPTLLLEWDFDKFGNPIVWEYGVRKGDTSKLKEPCGSVYRKIDDARVTEKGQVIFGDLDYLRRPTMKELAIELADLRRDKDTEMAVWARAKAGYGSTVKTKHGGASPYALGGEVAGEGLNPSVARCDKCMAPTCPDGYTLIVAVSVPFHF